MIQGNFAAGWSVFRHIPAEWLHVQGPGAIEIYQSGFVSERGEDDAPKMLTSLHMSRGRFSVYSR